ncbi:MAG: GTP cyclohydrolase I FolE [bacterium JZ-2024 1]
MREKVNTNIESLIYQLLIEIGENPDREGLKKTPFRVAKMYEELTRGYRLDPEKLLNKAIFESPHDEIVLVRNIEFYSLCEHHLMPFWGHAHIGYLPDGKIIGLSKIPRVVDMFSRRLQLQERLTLEIAQFLNEHLKPRGVAVILDAVHLCLSMRGARKTQARMTTSAMMGVFKEDPKTRNEFLLLVRGAYENS